MSAAAQAVAMRIAVHDLPRLPPGGRASSRSCCVLGLVCVLALLSNVLLAVRPSTLIERDSAATAPLAVPNSTSDATLRALRRLEQLEGDASDERVLRQIEVAWPETSSLTIDLARAVGWLARQARAPR